MEVKFSNREQMIKDSEKDLRLFEIGIETGFWKDQGYTDQQLADSLDLARKEVAYMKKEISFKEYNEAYNKVHERKVV